MFVILQFTVSAEVVVRSFVLFIMLSMSIRVCIAGHLDL